MRPVRRAHRHGQGHRGRPPMGPFPSRPRPRSSSRGGRAVPDRKTFLDGASARLLRLEGGRFVPIADGRNADSMLREILDATDAPRSRPVEAGALGPGPGALGSARHLETRLPVVERLESLRALGVQLTGERRGSRCCLKTSTCPFLGAASCARARTPRRFWPWNSSAPK